MSVRSSGLLISTLAFVSLAFAQAQKPAKVDDAALRSAAQSKGEDWLSYGFTPQETRYTPLKSRSIPPTFPRLGWPGPC